MLRGCVDRGVLTACIARAYVLLRVSLKGIYIAIAVNMLLWGYMLLWVYLGGSSSLDITDGLEGD